MKKRGELTIEFLSVDRHATSTVSLCEVTSLDHEVGNNSVKRRAFITRAVFCLCEFTEILSSPGDFVVIKLHDDATFSLAPDLDVELLIDLIKIARKKNSVWLKSSLTKTLAIYWQLK
jgi:hypothetical protein